ncbi:MAG: iron-sulfur cluster assembly accessory protein [Verrucomicrobia bacterium]|nr:iron-sulfur cluster assembly accessory protein [Verrucomicrobiota bacterium]
MNDVAECVVEVTEEAAAEIKCMRARANPSPGPHLRVYVEAGGCSGMQYGLVFDQARDGDLASEQHGVSLVVDGFSAPYLRGAVVDFSDALTGGGFKIRNPNARQSCGCGHSFET